MTTPTQVLSDDTIDAVSKALRRAWQLGQTYWQQADSNSWTQQAKSDGTQKKFEALVDETRALLAAVPQKYDACDPGNWRDGDDSVGNHVATAPAQPCGGDAALPQAAMPAWRDVVRERRRQIGEEGWTTEHDDLHSESEMALAAACYAMSAGGYAKGQTPPIWPWSLSWWKPAYGRRDLVKAAALILAEIERIDRAKDSK